MQTVQIPPGQTCVDHADHTYLIGANVCRISRAYIRISSGKYVLDRVDDTDHTRQTCTDHADDTAGYIAVT